MKVIVVGAFDNLAHAEEARRALVHAGVPHAHIALDAAQNGGCILGVRAQSTLERERITALLLRNGARSTGLRSR
jgi:hypothetical protein